MANEIRVRANNISGTTTNNPLTAGATTINSPGFVDLPVINTTNHLLLVLDPLEVNGAAEIVRVTTHVSSGTSVTVVRGAENTTPREHPLGTTWFHGPVTTDYTEVLTSTTRPTVPYTGEILYETDTGLYKSFNGTSWVDLAVPLAGAWASYVPSTANITVGNGTQSAFFTRIGRTIIVRWNLNWGSTTSFAGNIQVGLPVAASAASFNNGMVGSAYMLDAGTRELSGSTRFVTASSTQVFVITGDGGTVNATVPWTWATSDNVSFTMTYEAAS